MGETGAAGQNRIRRDEARRLDRPHTGALWRHEGAPESDYVTVEEAAGLLRVCTKTVYARIDGGQLEAYRHGRRILIPRPAIERLIKRGRI